MMMTPDPAAGPVPDTVWPALDGGGWYAVHTRSNFERRTAEDLARKGLEAYVPVVRELHQWKDRKKTIDRPLFPGYVFVRSAAIGGDLLRILQTPGAVRVLGNGGHPERVPEREIEAVRALVASGAPLVRRSLLQEGAAVRVRGGVLAGVEGLLVRAKNTHRLVISIGLLCQSVSAEIDIRDVEVLRPAAGGRN